MANPQPDKYIKISTELFERICKTRISGEARQMFDFIIRKTYGFKKSEDIISTSQFVKGTGLHRQAIAKARKKMKEMNIITVTKKGNSQFLCYSIQKNYEKWKVLPKKVTVTKKGKQVLPKKVRTVTQKATTIDTTTIDTNTIDNNIHSRVIDDLNCLLGTRYKYTTTKTNQLISARLKDGFVEEDFKVVHRNMKQAWQGDKKMNDFLRPITLYSYKFESYLNIKKGTINESGNGKGGDKYDGIGKVVGV